jgi:hypothetical protein
MLPPSHRLMPERTSLPRQNRKHRLRHLIRQRRITSRTHNYTAHHRRMPLHHLPEGVLIASSRKSLK